MLQDNLMNSRSKKAKRFRREKLKIGFENVLGCDSAKNEIMEIVDFLENPERFSKIGARQPKGALLSGPPGTGKTMLAKAAAAKANVPFYYISGSEFVERYVGVGAANVRGLFAEARRTAPSIIFIDEIDAIGTKRDKQNSSGEKESTLNQLLVEMDGFESHDKVIVIAATNRPGSLDPALKRPGRFDRLITVELPSFKGREDILKMYLAKIRLEGSFDNEMESEKTETEDLNNHKKDHFSLHSKYKRYKKYKLERINQKIKDEMQKEKMNINNMIEDINIDKILAKKKLKNYFKKIEKLERKLKILGKMMKEDISNVRSNVLDSLGLYGLKFDILESKSIKKSLEQEKVQEKSQMKQGRFTNPESELDKHSKRLSALSPGFSGADLKNLCNEAAILAARENKSFVTIQDFEEASERVLGGLKKSEELDYDTRKTVAIHESGHAVVSWFLASADPLVKVSIIPRTKGSLGFAQYLVKETPIRTREEIKDRLKFLLGGRMAEILFLGKASTGAHDDLEKAFNIASKFVAEYCMTER